MQLSITNLSKKQSRIFLIIAGITALLAIVILGIFTWSRLRQPAITDPLLVRLQTQFQNQADVNNFYLTSKGEVVTIVSISDGQTAASVFTGRGQTLEQSFRSAVSQAQTTYRERGLAIKYAKADVVSEVIPVSF